MTEADEADDAEAKAEANYGAADSCCAKRREPKKRRGWVKGERTLARPK